MEGASEEVVLRTNSIWKNPFDNNQYRGIELANGLRALLVSSSRTGMSAAAMRVKVGSLMDPIDYQGLAHFCEHMVVTGGSQKYPDENGFKTFAKSNYGYFTASTGSDMTSYVFKVPSECFEEALDRFSQCFVSPVFTESLAEREVKAVDSEFWEVANKYDEKLVAVRKALSKKGHDYRKFACGNSKTLRTVPGRTLKQAVKTFHDTHYSANLMTLCVIDNRPLDEMEETLKTLDFHKIPNKNLETKVWNEHPYGRDDLGFIVKLAGSSSVIRLEFPTDDFDQFYNSQPAEYVVQLINCPLQGGLFANLKERNWIEQLVAHHKTIARGFGLFSITITINWLKHVPEMLELIFSYIGHLKRVGVQEWIHKEILSSRMLKERHSKISSDSRATELSAALGTVPFEDVLKKGFADSIDQGTIYRVLDHLDPYNMNCMVMSSETDDSNFPLRDEHYDFMYKKSKIEEQGKENCRVAMEKSSGTWSLPYRNPYLVDMPNVEHIEYLKTKVRTIRDDEFVNVRHQQKSCPKKPKLEIGISVVLPSLCDDLQEFSLAYMFAQYFKFAFTEELYHAGLAEITFHMKTTMRGFTIHCTGLDRQLVHFVESLFEKLASFKPECDESCIQPLEPYDKVRMLLNCTLFEKHWSIDDLRHKLRYLTVTDVQDFAARVWNVFRLEFAVEGNLTKEESQKMAENVLQTMQKKHPFSRSFREEEVPRNRCARIEERILRVEHVEKVDPMTQSCVLFYIPVEDEDSANLELLGNIMASSSHTILRTREQLGYTVFSRKHITCATQGIAIVVQGGYNPHFVERRIEAFLVTLREEIKNMGKDEFDHRAKSVASYIQANGRLYVKDETLLWTDFPEFQFSKEDSEKTKRKAKRSQVLKTTKRELLDFFDRRIAADSKERGSVVSIHLRSNTPLLKDDEKKRRREENGKQEEWIGRKKQRFNEHEHSVNEDSVNFSAVSCKFLKDAIGFGSASLRRGLASLRREDHIS
ncbi:hypothetical protein L596_019451 [Steinernema carpocapsae]|uniref:Peptidase M16 N-terminal domain-containing protein n=1 Tax=Steinernema carpocapsae TaxID=34508 RepID=A0A4U5MQM7_STECR|nr:hypothetical protein L596_019451 [Steinernema carpocapsae]